MDKGNRYGGFVMENALRKIAEHCTKGGVLIFTGAGISAESGIPTFRGPDGVWKKYDPEKVATIDAFQQDPSLYWRFFLDVRLPLLKKVKPNAAHYAVTQLQKDGWVSAVVTQNIDGLHQAAGTENVLELHGSTRRFLCTRCDFRCGLDEIDRILLESFPPVCERCGAVLRPDVVLFGEPLPAGVLEAAFEAARRSKIALSIGSSLVVYPAALVPQHAQSFAIINLEPTPLDGAAVAVVREKASIALPRLVEILKERE